MHKCILIVSRNFAIGKVLIANIYAVIFLLHEGQFFFLSFFVLFCCVFNYLGLLSFCFVFSRVVFLNQTLFLLSVSV